MAEITQNPPDPEQDSDESTPDPDVEEMDEADAQPGTDADARLADAQALITRQQQELALFRKGERSTATNAEQTAETAGNDYQQRLEDDSWQLAEQIYGGAVVEAYASAAELLDRAVTPADHLAAFEAYYSIRSGETAAPATESGKPTRSEALTPTVESNRSDLGPDQLDAQQKLDEARKGNSLSAFTNAATRVLGFGPKT